MNGKNKVEIIEGVYSRWYKISYDNYHMYLIEDCVHHNLVVLMVAVLDLVVDSFSFYVQTITDPLHSFIEFTMRFCIFRNVILSLEVHLSLYRPN